MSTIDLNPGPIEFVELQQGPPGALGTTSNASGLETLTTTVSVSGSAAPTVGQILTAIDSETATWQTPSSGAGDMVLASVQSVTGKKTFDTTKIAVKGSSTGVTTFASANSSATNYTQTFPAATGTIALTSNITGTVTATGGSLTSNSLVLGAGTVDTKVSTGITSDGTAQLILGVNATTIGKVKLFGNTSGDVTIQPTAAAGTATVQTLPATTGTLVNRVTTGNGVSASNSDGALSFTLGAITPSTIELGHASDTTLSRVSAGVIAVEGSTIPTLTSVSKFITGLKTFASGMFALRNVADTFNALFTNTNTADRTYTLKDANGTIAFTSDIGRETLIDFTGLILVPSLAAANAATYSQSGNTITVTSTGHNIPATTFNGSTVYLAIGTVSTGVAPTSVQPNFFTDFQRTGADTFTCVATNSQTGTGIVNTNTASTVLLPLSYSLGANYFNVGDYLSVAGAFSNNNSAGTKQITLLFKGTIIYGITQTTTSSSLLNHNNGAIFVSPTKVYRQVASVSSTSTDITTSGTLSVNFILNSANDYVCLESINVLVNRRL